MVAPAATLSGSKLQRLGKVVGVRVSCPAEPCRATAGGTVRVPRIGATRARNYRLKASTAAIPNGKKSLLRPQLSRAARTAIGRALGNRRRIVVSLRVTVVDKAGNRKTLGRRVRLKL